VSLYDAWLMKQSHRASLELGEPLKERGEGQYCRNCRFMRRHTYSERYNYCALKKSSHTADGMGKTKRLSWCPWWKALPENPK